VDLLLLKGFLPFFSDFLCADPPGPFLLSRRRPLHILAVQCTNRNTGSHKGFAKSKERHWKTTLPSHLATFEGFGPHEHATWAVNNKDAYETSVNSSLHAEGRS
jgi:hypothetical protein